MLRLVLIVILINSKVFAINIKGQFKGNVAKFPDLIHIQSYHNFETDTFLKVGDFGDFNIDFPIKQYELFKIEFGRNRFDLLLSPNEKVLRVDIDVKENGFAKPDFSESKENYALKEFLITIYNKFDFYKIRFYNSNSDQETASIFNEFSAEIQSLIPFMQYYQGTYVETILFSPFKNFEKYQNLNHFFDAYILNVSFHSDISAHCGLHELIYVLISHYYKNPQSLSSYFDALYNSNLSEDAKLNQFLLIFDLSVYNNLEYAANAFYDWGSLKFENNEALKIRLNKLGKAKTGNVLLDYNCLNDKKEKINLSKLVKDQNYNLLVIFSPECSHCREEIPKLPTKLKKFEAKLNVITLAKDVDIKVWQTFISKNIPNYKNAYIEGTDAQSIGDELLIYSIPSFILLDSDGKIVQRFIKGYELEKTLEKFLN